MGETAGDGIAWNACCSAGLAPRGRVGDVAEDFGFRCAQVLPDCGQSQAVKIGESGEVWRGEGRIGQRRGLSKMASVVTSILLEDLDFFVLRDMPGNRGVGFRWLHSYS